MLPMLVFLWACFGERVQEEDPVDPLSWPVEELGPYNVGYTSWDTTYTPPTASGEREIKLHAWYPTDATTGEPVVYELAFTDDIALGEAPPSPPAHADGYPVLVHSHGYQGFAGNSAFLMRWYASHGWVAIAPDHTGNTLTTHVDPLPTAHHIWRPADITEALDALTDHPNFSKADTSTVIMSGHSFGTYTTWGSGGGTYDLDRIQQRCDNGDMPCTELEIDAFGSPLGDGRIVALIPMAGTIRRDWFGDTGHRSIFGPMMAMTGTDDGPEGAQEQWDQMDTIDFTWIEVTGGCHQIFGFGGCTQISNDDGFGIISTYALAFGRAHVLGDESVGGILSGNEPVSDLAAFQRMNQP